MTLAAILYMAPKSIMHISTKFVSAKDWHPSSEMLDRQKKNLETKEWELRQAILEARANLAEMVLLFEGATQRAWIEAIKEFESMLKEEDLERCADAIIRGLDKKTDFLHLAAKDIPMRFSPTSSTDEEKAMAQETQRDYKQLMKALRSESIDEILAYLKRQGSSAP